MTPIKLRFSAAKFLLFAWVLGTVCSAFAGGEASQTPTTQQDFLKAAKELKAMRWASARAGFREVLRKDPENLKAHFYLGEIEYYTHHLDDADGYFKWVDFHDPDTPVNHYYLGRVAYDQERYEAALKEMNKADRLDGHISIVHYYLGLIHYRQKDIPGCRKELERALALDPSSSKAHYALAYLLYHKFHKPSLALGQANAALKGDSDEDIRVKATRLIHLIQSDEKG